jgi:GT2 family glycosyltransferase
MVPTYFAIVPHDSGEGAAGKLLQALEFPIAYPYSGRPYSLERERRIAGRRACGIDVVLCVHNALEDATRCIASIRRARRSETQKLIIVDDASDSPTADYLEGVARSAAWIKLIRNEEAKGYTKAANKGLAASSGEFVILLNSDTIVTDGWAEKLADAAFSTPGVGIVGPLSNAASHQSVPDHRGSNGQTAINELPAGLTPEEMNRFCEEWTMADILPRVPLVHGFCLGLRREVLDAVGFFDEISFPNGYGEENDFCFRAADAGFGLIVATHTYVFHAKSKSYSNLDRVRLMKAGSQAFRRIHGQDRVQRAVKSMQENPLLRELRSKARQLYEQASKNTADRPRAQVPHGRVKPEHLIERNLL